MDFTNDNNTTPNVPELDNSTIEAAKRYFENCCEFFEHVKKMSEDVHITMNETEDIFDILISEEFRPMYENKNDVIEGVNFYKMLFDRLKTITTYQEIIDFVEFFMFDNEQSPHLTTHYQLIQFVSKIVIHNMWNIIYIVSPRFRNDPNDAILDIVYPIQSIQKELKKIVEHLEVKRNKTI